MTLSEISASVDAGLKVYAGHVDLPIVKIDGRLVVRHGGGNALFDLVRHDGAPNYDLTKVFGAKVRK